MILKDWEFKRMIQRLHRQVGQFKRHQKKELRCSDGLPCTAETCVCGWCQFPERREVVKRTK